MESATTLAVMTAGLFFSCCLALLAEELLCGAIFHWFFRSAAGPGAQNPTARVERSAADIRPYESRMASGGKLKGRKPVVHC